MGMVSTRSGLLASALLCGCYVYTPVMTMPEPGTPLAIELNDVGRVGMANQVGPGVANIEGVLESRTDTQNVLRVSLVMDLYGGQSRWNGERITFRQDYVRTAREKRFSSSRTAVLAGTLATAFGAFMLTRNLLGLGGGGDAPGPPVPPGDQ